MAEICAVSGGQQESARLQVLRQCAEEDVEHQQLLHYVRDGFPDRRNMLPEGCRSFWGVRGHLSVDDGLIVYGCHLVILAKMRHEILSKLHESHQGSVRTKQRAQLSVYWPGIDNCIDSIILSCKHCQERLPSNPKEPLVVKPGLLGLFKRLQWIFVRMADKTFSFLLFVAWIGLRYSTWAETLLFLSCSLPSDRHSAVQVHLSDQGPQFTSRLFREFAADWGFQHIMSFPRYPQSNGKTEAAVKSMRT